MSINASVLVAGDASVGKEYQEMGFLDRRSKGYSILWLALASFAKSDGEICLDTRGLHNRIHKNLKSYVNRLSKILMGLFQIKNCRPFEYHRKTGCYSAKFRAKLDNEDAYDDILGTFRNI
jgi:hypothetical protein